MLFFPRRVEHAFDVTIQRSHHAYPSKTSSARHVLQPAIAPALSLPFSGVRFLLWVFGRVRSGVEQGNELAAVRQHNRIVEATLPGQSFSTPTQTESEFKHETGKRSAQKARPRIAPRPATVRGTSARPASESHFAADAASVNRGVRVHVAARSKRARRNVALHCWSRRHVLPTQYIFSVMGALLELEAVHA